MLIRKVLCVFVCVCALFQVCEAQQHFSRYVDSEQEPLPQFWGHLGPHVATKLVLIDTQFHRLLLCLKQHKASILDVKSHIWHKEFNM